MDGANSGGSPEILLHAGPDEVAEALAARLMARLPRFSETSGSLRSRSPAVGSPPGRISGSPTRDRTQPSTGPGSSSGGETSDLCPPTMLTGTPSRPLTCLPSHWRSIRSSSRDAGQRRRPRSGSSR